MHKNSYKADSNRSSLVHLYGWNQQNALLSMYCKPICRPNGPGIGGGGKPDRFTYQKQTRIGKEYKFYHYDDPNAYILQYRRDCTLTSSSKDNYDKGPLENVNKSVVDGINKLENDNIQQPANNHIQKNESLIENSDPKQPSIVETNNSQLQYEPEIKHTKSTLPSTFNRHMWVNTCPTSVFLNNRSTKILNMDISTSKVNHIKQRRMKKESPFASKTCLSQPNTGKLNDVNVTNNNSNLLSIPCNKSVTRLNIESSREGINLHQLIRDANQPGFWPLLYKKLLELQATQSNMIEEDMNMKNVE